MISTKAVAGAISIYPNPVKGNTINVLLSNQVKGNYQLRLTNIAGQVMYTGNMNSENGNGVLVVNIPSKLTAGSYQLEVITPEGKRNTQKVIAE